jgi:hypothetical protein
MPSSNGLASGQWPFAHGQILWVIPGISHLLRHCAAAFIAAFSHKQKKLRKSNGRGTQKEEGGHFSLAIWRFMLYNHSHVG